MKLVTESKVFKATDRAMTWIVWLGVVAALVSTLAAVWGYYNNGLDEAGETIQTLEQRVIELEAQVYQGAAQ